MSDHKLSEIEPMFEESMLAVQKIAHRTAKDKGWWENRVKLLEVARAHSPELGKFAETCIHSMSIALMHSELSEALEALRHGNPPDDKVPQHSGAEAEFADTLIRMFDHAEAMAWNIPQALITKMRFNSTREHMHGGKKF